MSNYDIAVIGAGVFGSWTAYHLQLAIDQFEHARKLSGAHDQVQAARLLQRAQADADLALAVARTEAERSQAQSIIDKVNHLPGTMQR